MCIYIIVSIWQFYDPWETYIYISIELVHGDFVDTTDPMESIWQATCLLPLERCFTGSDHSTHIRTYPNGYDIYMIQWPFQKAKSEVPTIYKAYIRPM